MTDYLLDQHLQQLDKAYKELVEEQQLEEKMNKEEKICDFEGCGFPTSECMIPNHPLYCGEHLEAWYLEICKRIEAEQMAVGQYPDYPGV